MLTTHIRNALAEMEKALGTMELKTEEYGDTVYYVLSHITQLGVARSYTTGPDIILEWDRELKRYLSEPQRTLISTHFGLWLYWIRVR